MRVAFLALAVLAIASTASAEPVRLKTDSGTLVGVSKGGVNSFKGFPYAKPPVGELRWRPPQRVTWNGERQAMEFALPCPQPTPADGRLNGGGVSGPTHEDCLYMNVWAPKNARNAPVMVWLYGGAGYLGAGHLGSYDGSAFAKQGVIVVTLNYRLGMLGNYAHPALTKAAGAEPVANYALMDAIAGLEWVQRNGRALGANTDNVTLFGQSAGGLMVSSLLASPPARGLFHKAIIHSGAFFGGGRSLPEAEAAGAKIASALGLPGEAATLEQLRAVPPEAMTSNAASRSGVYMVVDGKIRTMATRDGFASGATVDVPLIVGSNNGEPGAGAAREAVRLAATHGKAAAWQYYFTYVPAWRTAEQPRGAPHSAELPYAFDALSTSTTGGGAQVTNADRAVARRMNGCWVAFAKAPVTATSLTCADGFTWPAQTAQNDAIAVFGETPRLATATPIVAENTAAFPPTAPR
ncbi:carboxylesterase/lipase family protein [Phenylobacterium sp.]|uniref:carboxylesterase/lipase family protein n=1 Tax=Phenylobacterium sp. TaxID=1871053 RepID=UPI0035B43397